jgi:hypothetical protein
VSETTLGIIIFVTIALVVSTLSYALSHSYLLPSIVAAIISSVLFNIYITWSNGYVDAFIAISLITGSIWAWLVSLSVAIAFKYLRVPRKTSE